jgi:hypothetical protein
MVGRDETGRFKKGMSGNPNGRPKKEREMQYMEIALNTVSFEQFKRIVQKAAEQAEAGDWQARKWLGDYLIGQPVQKLEHAGANGDALRIVVEYVDNTITDEKAA